MRLKISDCDNYPHFNTGFLEVLNLHAPLKKKIIRANEVPYMTKALRKAIATRSRLENRYHREKSDDSLRSYKKQKNFCSRLYKKERKKYYENLDITKITDNKKFWKTMKPFFSDKGAAKTDITLTEGGRIVQADLEVADVMNNFFDSAVASLNIGIPEEFISSQFVDTGNAIDNIISKYCNHPSIQLINENITKGCFSFEKVTLNDVTKQVESIDSKKASMSSSIPPKFLKENSDICCEPLKQIINNGIEHSNFDSELKLADLTPIHKCDDTTDKKNYRNISLLHIVSKIFEKIIQGQV